jgi:hypothetical protein|tara:strand:- start:1133 stop:1531 length:399 start_codon:yes stop_codon:yes gene_type:complete
MTPELGTKEFAKLITSELMEWTASIEEKYGGDVWRYFAINATSFVPEGDSSSVGIFAAGREINILSGLFKWMDETAHTRKSMGLVDDAQVELVRMASVLDLIASSKGWMFDTSPIKPDDVQISTGKSNIPTK